MSLDQHQCDKIGPFLQLLGNKLSHKSSPNILLIFGLFLIMSLLCKKCVATFWAVLGGKLGNFLFQHLVTLISTQHTHLPSTHKDRSIHIERACSANVKPSVKIYYDLYARAAFSVTRFGNF